MQTTETIRSLERVLTEASAVLARPEGFAGRIAQEIERQRQGVAAERRLDVPRFEPCREG